MSLEPLGLNAPNADALRALGHMTQVIDASESRIQRANDEIIQQLRTALEQSENNNRLLADQNARLNERVTQLEQRRAEIKVTRKLKHQAVEEHLKLLNTKLLELVDKMSSRPLQALFCTEVRHWLGYIYYQGSDCGTILGCTDGFSGSPGARVAFLLEKIDYIYRERVKASNRNVNCFTEEAAFFTKETESAMSSIKAQLIDIESEFKKVLTDIDD